MEEKLSRMTWGLRQYRVMDFHEGFEWMRRTVLGIYSLRFTSLLTSLDHSWLVWVESSLLDVSHILMFGKREVRTFEPPILPSIPQHIPSPSSDRWRTFVEVRIDHILSPSQWLSLLT
jgi:hypothetical protein